uniref:Reverse transcriptase zinc-binding domain-containing protein n=1 Tax=Fagus sylvatica TaxID=28930 RepID=A0A2N9G2I3_FAGSY
MKNLRKFNEALLGKWLWRFGMEKEAFWRKVIMAKYGIMEGGWMSNIPNGPHGDDVWCSEEPLKLAYPALYRIAYVKEAVVADCVHFRGDFVHWEADGESVDHLFLHCPYAKELWDMILALFGIHWVMPKRVLDLFHLLAREFGQSSAFCGLEGHSSLFDVVSLERAQCESL